MYKLHQNSSSITRLSDSACIPADADNNDYVAYLEWALTNETQAADPVITPRITKVTMRQARLALLGAGLLPSVNAAIAEMTGSQGEAARIEWEYSQEVQRDRGLVAALGTQMGMSATQLDALFSAASAIP